MIVNLKFRPFDLGRQWLVVAKTRREAVGTAMGDRKPRVAASKKKSVDGR